jgi:hypothetical protein
VLAESWRNLVPRLRGDDEWFITYFLLYAWDS